MRQTQTSVVLLVAVIAFVTFASVFAGFSSCTRETCLGPVVVAFSNSDCTGEITFADVNVEFGQCDQGHISLKDDLGVSFYYVDSDQEFCSITSANASYEVQYHVWGACQPNTATRRSIVGQRQHLEFSATELSFMYLSNVNASYVSPQIFDNQPLPKFDFDFVNCYGINNCTLNNGQPALSWATRYTDVGTCQEPDYSYMNGAETIDTCTNYNNQTYFKVGCFDAHGSYSAMYQDAACTKLSGFSAARYVCSGSNYDNTCNAPLTPLPTPPRPEPSSPSGASTFHLSAILVLIALFASLVEF
jgi:hypothetical protein